MRAFLAVLALFLACILSLQAQDFQISESSEQGASALQQDLDALSNDRTSSSLDDEFEGFITFKEYGKNLYENPRGIGCNKCHGASGEGAMIAKYSHKGVQKTLSAPNIKNLEFSQFVKILHKKKTGVMPNYYLTDREIEAIYNYVYEQKGL